MFDPRTSTTSTRRIGTTPENAKAVDPQGRGKNESVISAQEPAPGLDAARHAAGQEADAQVDAIRNTILPSSLMDALGLHKCFTFDGYQRYLEKLVENAGSPTDPLPTMLVEQLGLLHLIVPGLLAAAAQAKSIEGTKVYAAASARLLGEMRRLILAIQEYRGSRLTEKKLRVAKVG
jgi:hypothetical protein